jgi:hypothetical protein
MKNIDQMIAELEITVASDKRSRVYGRLVKVMGEKAAFLIFAFAEGVRAPEDYGKMRYSHDRVDAGILTADQALVVLRWLKTDVIPIIVG